VKVRGFRIELGEIASALTQNPAVRSAVVVAHEHTSADKQLVAYVVAEPGSSATAGELRDHLKQILPHFMVPSFFVMLDSFPQTTSGKIDVRALPKPETFRSELDDDFVAPRTAAEKELSEIWCKLLKVERVGIHDNFFDLGGHSLLLTRLASHILRAFQVNVSIPVLFNGPTVLEMSEAIAIKQMEQENADELATMLREVQQLSSHEVSRLLEVS
jgi:hypothetical protein